MPDSICHSNFLGTYLALDEKEMVATDVAVKNTFKKSAGYNKPYCIILYYSQEKSLECLEINTVAVSTDVAIKNTF